MNRVLKELHGLNTVIETEHSTLHKYVVSLEYHLWDATPRQDKDDANGDTSPSSGKRRKLDMLRGMLVVTVGCDSAWWSTSVEGEALASLVTSGGLATPSSGTTIDSANVSEEQYQPFAAKVRSAFRRQSIMVGVKKAATKEPHLWPSIKLYIDVEENPIQLKLDRLTDRLALVQSTAIVLRSSIYAPAVTTAQTSALNEGESVPLAELHSLQRKLEATQQALREERHKYRSLLAAPSAANARAGRRPVVGLGPAVLPGASQRSQIVSQQPSSPSSRSKAGLPSSSSSSGGVDDDAPSSDGLERVSQRTLSLVNPTRVRRADPSENDGFVGDDDDDV
ncbi:uncharacterized protein SRS1_15421 [Sporisorium reilianum f. sp. reilianum]|uniref:Uncharacterized protein n=1 Tax=Sporisorium reilianum f. sp. reilianum TaxID=72559 RepID=A0A2N8UI13_9BASI|nr:uncharacterized protein SRS1_15421 [Sporisorium reilianum f. sp. reilianum]